MPSVSRYTPKHIAWLLPVGTLFFLCGILLGRIAQSWIPAFAMLVLSGLAALLSRRWRRTAALVMAALSAGALLSWRTYHPVLPAEGDYTVRATVMQEIVTDERGQVQTLLTGVMLDGQPAPDGYWTFYLDEEETLPEWLIPGAQLEMKAAVYHPRGQSNPGGFDFREYLLQRGVGIGVYGAQEMTPVQHGFSLRGRMAALRHRLSLSLMEAMGSEAGAYAAAMLLGTRDFIPQEERAAFQALGIAHILSVSGYHVGVLALLLILLMKPLPTGRGVQTVLEGLLLGAYCLLTGGNAPVIRAVGLLLWREITRMQHRSVAPLHMLCVTAVVQLAFNPALLTGASFQLTYGAMLGLLLVFPRLRKQRVCRTVWGQRVWESLAGALSAQLGILLPQLYWFGDLPLLAVLLNMLIIPYAGVMMTLYWATLAALPVPGLRMLLGSLSAGATSVLLWVVRRLDALEAASLWTRRADVFTLAGWVLLLWSMSGLVPRRAERFRRPAVLLGTALAALILLPLPETETSYLQLSVGDADAAILQDHHVTVVIDAGGDDLAAAEYLHQRRQDVELLILTHLHTDHAGGLRALLDQGIGVDVCCLPADAQTPVIDAQTLPLLAELAATGTEFCCLSRGDVIGLPSGTLTVLWPEKGRVFPVHDANDVCLVLQAEIGGVTMLLTSDVSGMYEMYSAAPADILKVAHHGSADSTSEAFMAQVQPRLLLLSNRDEVREARVRALAGERMLYTTGRDGGITIRFLGNGEYEVKTAAR